MLRRGCHIEAIVDADSAARGVVTRIPGDRDCRSRCTPRLSRGRGAGVLSAGEVGCGTGDERRDALWGELACLIDLEGPRSGAALAAFGGSLAWTAAGVRSLGCVSPLPSDAFWVVGSRTGGRRISPVVCRERPPGRVVLPERLRRQFGVGRSLSRGAVSVSRARRLVRRYRLHFALPYALCVSATASAGLREWTDAERRAREALESLMRVATDMSSTRVIRFSCGYLRSRVVWARRLTFSRSNPVGQSRHLARKSCVPVRLFWPARAAQLKRLASWMRSEARPTRLRPLCFLQLLRRSVRSGSAQRT